MGTAVVCRRAIDSRAYASVMYVAAHMLNQLRRDHRAWPMFELKSGAAMAAPAAPMPPPLHLFFGTAKSVLSVLDEDSNIKMTVLKSRMTKMGPRKVVKNTAGPEMKQL